MEHQVSQSTDMLTIILINLPVKSLMRFRCVSKRWLGFIKSESFASKYSAKETLLLKCFPLREEPDSPDTFDVEQQHTVEPFFSFHDPDFPDSSVVLPTLSVPFVDFFYYLCAPSNGLFCLVDRNVVVLCNPALREFELIPPTPFSWPDGYSYFNFSGFGFDVRSNSYKILHFWYGFIVGDGSFRIDLYNSSTNSWRHIDEEVSLCNYGIRSDLVFNGAFHWLTKGEYSGDMGVILSFDISTEIFRQFELSDDDINSGHMNSALIVWNECLAVAIHMRYCITDFVGVWVMKEYGVNESWTKELVINTHSFRRSYVCWKNEWLFVESDEKLAFCALQANEFRQYQLPKKGYCCNALIFRPSLISVKKHFVGEKTSHGWGFMHNS